MPTFEPGPEFEDWAVTSAVQEICAELRREPLFHMSLHSRELFHSNFLAWVLESHPEAGALMLYRWSQWTDDPNHWVLREYRNLDLVVKAKDLEVVVIENKVFDLPSEEQLDRYAEKVESEGRPRLLLLSMHDPGWPDGRYASPNGLVWTHVPYSALATALNGATVSIPNRFDSELVEHYCAMVKLLVGLLEATALDDFTAPIHVDGDAASELRDIRLYASVAKMRAHQAAALLNRTPLANVAPITAGFTRNTPILQQFFELPNGDRLGWQYQGRQWRLAVITSRYVGTSPDLRRQREQYVASKYSAWFEFGAVEQFAESARLRHPRPRRASTATPPTSFTATATFGA